MALPWRETQRLEQPVGISSLPESLHALLACSSNARRRCSYSSPGAATAPLLSRLSAWRCSRRPPLAVPLRDGARRRPRALLPVAALGSGIPVVALGSGLPAAAFGGSLTRCSPWRPPVAALGSGAWLRPCALLPMADTRGGTRRRTPRGVARRRPRAAPWDKEKIRWAFRV